MSRRFILAIAVAAGLGLTFAGRTAPQPLPPGYIASFTVTNASSRFGGFSGIEVSDDGIEFTALSDRGAFVRGQFRRDAKGQISGVQLGKITRLKVGGKKMPNLSRIDSEGLAMPTQGGAYVSFEGQTRVLFYPDLTGPPTTLPIPNAFADLQVNVGPEALAIDDKGRLYTVPESNAAQRPLTMYERKMGMDDGAPLPIYRYANGAWTQPFDLPRLGDLLPVGADFGPDGRLYLLERAFHGLSGFSSRVRSFAVTDTELRDGRVEFETGAGVHDNLEGLSVWRDGQGQMRLTMISDDNFTMFQRTEIVEYRVLN